MSRHIHFLKQFLKNPIAMGAIAPSSRRLAQLMTDWPQLEAAQAVVEFGPGDGSVTPFILEKLQKEAQFFAMELSPEMCLRLKKSYPTVQVYNDSACQVRQYLDSHNIRHADVIVCGLPWAAFSSHLQDEIMNATLEALAPNGRFVTFAYLQGLLLPAGQRFKSRLDQAFSHVSRSRVVWKNLPPAFVYQCVK